MSKDLGWIKIHRKIQDTKGYFSESFCRNMAWIDLILLANHEDNFFRFRGIKIDVKRGQTGVGIDNFCYRWRWSRGKVERFLKELEKDEKIVRQKTNITTLISILNYEQYQETVRQTEKQVIKQAEKQVIKQTETNKNDKNDKNDKEGDAKINFSDFVCYDVENFILSDQIIFEKICIATQKNAAEVKTQLHLYHLWMAKNEKYPIGKGAATAGIESWIHNAKSFSKKYNQNPPVKVDKLPDANELAKKYDR